MDAQKFITGEDRAVCTEQAMQNGVLPREGSAVSPVLANPTVYDPAPTTTAAECLGGANPATAAPDMVEPGYGAAPDMEVRTTH